MKKSFILFWLFLLGYVSFTSYTGVYLFKALLNANSELQQQIKELEQLVISLEADLRICQGEE